MPNNYALGFSIHSINLLSENNVIVYAFNVFNEFVRKCRRKCPITMHGFFIQLIFLTKLNVI